MIVGGGSIDCNPHTRALVRAYLLAKQRVIASGFEEEIAWQETVSLDEITPMTFMREAAWVVLCTGMRESVVRARFELLGQAFGLWDPMYISNNSAQCQKSAKTIFNHATKISSIARIAAKIADNGIEWIVDGIRREGPVFLTRLPFIGRVTCFHLAKNIGCPVSKPDRHLKRMAAALGYARVSSFCGVISEALDEPIQVVDLVMWRFATIEHKYELWMRNSTSNAPYASCLSTPKA